MKKQFLKYFLFWFVILLLIGLIGVVLGSDIYSLSTNIPGLIILFVIVPWMIPAQLGAGIFNRQAVVGLRTNTLLVSLLVFLLPTTSVAALLAYITMMLRRQVTFSRGKSIWILAGLFICVVAAYLLATYLILTQLTASLPGVSYNM